MYTDQRCVSEATILDCCGRFDETDHDQFMATIEGIHSDGCRHLVINLTSLYFLDPKVVGLLRFAYEYFQATARHVSLISPLSAVRNELHVAKITDTIPVYPTVYDALHRPHKPATKEESLVTAEASA